MASHYPSYDLYGAKITPMTSDEVLDLLDSHIRTGEQCVVASQNVHGLHVRLWDAASRQLHALRRTYVHIDGMPIVALSRLSGRRVSRRHRVGMTYFVWPLLTAAADAGWRVYYVGSTEDVLVSALAKIKARLPHLQLKAHNGYFVTSQESAAVARDIVEFDAQLVLVGMGMGVQERWILRHLRTIAPASVVTVGACMEYVSGAVRICPAWMSRTGIEWLFRLCENPRRFWYRYMIEPWFVLAYIAWYSSLPDRARLAGRIEELQFSSVDVREIEFSETA